MSHFGFYWDSLSNCNVNIHNLFLFWSNMTLSKRPLPCARLGQSAPARDHQLVICSQTQLGLFNFKLHEVCSCQQNLFMMKEFRCHLLYVWGWGGWFLGGLGKWLVWVWALLGNRHKLIIVHLRDFCVGDGEIKAKQEMSLKREIIGTLENWRREKLYLWLQSILLSF